jgi:hypothetical protein
MKDSFFKDLDDADVKVYRQWARENFKAGGEIRDIWHPVVRDECKNINGSTGYKGGR